MKKSSLTTAVVAGLAGVAGLVNVSTAVNINPDGMGQVLIYPYYTVNNDLVTLISVVNTTNDVKAVKVRFLEGRNSQEVLDFNLYLSPFDVWTGAVSDGGDADGAAILSTGDTSCTVPDIVGRPNSSVEFVNHQYAANLRDGGPYGLDRTREGHLEIIEMGRVVDSGDVSSTGGTSVEAVDPNPADSPPATRLATWATHITTAAGDRVPANCGAVRAAWAGGGIWATTDGNADIDEPNGGLFGGASIVDVAGGSNLSYNADAIDGFFTIEDANLHADPGTIEPTLAAAQTDAVNGLATSRIFDNGTLITLDFESGTPDAVSSVFMNQAIFNEYVTGGSTAAASEWVVTFPTKLLHLQLAQDVTPSGRLPFTAINRPAETPGPDLVLPYTAAAGACEPIDIDFYDREEDTAGNVPDQLEFSPPPPGIEAPGLNLCFEAQVVTFNQPTVGDGFDASAVLGSRYARNINLCRVFNADGSCTAAGAFTEGWVRMDLGDDGNYLDSLDVDGDGFYSRAFGLPVTGFWAADYLNANAQPGLLAAFSGLHRHRGDRDGVTVEDGVGPVSDGAGGFLTWS